VRASHGTYQTGLKVKYRFDDVSLDRSLQRFQHRKTEEFKNEKFYTRDLKALKHNEMKLMQLQEAMECKPFHAEN
jgi:hypothetical protein